MVGYADSECAEVPVDSSQSGRRQTTTSCPQVGRQLFSLMAAPVAPDGAPTRSVGEDKKATEHLANERTFLAWVRTSIAVISLGFVVAKFGLWLERMAGASTLPQERGSGWSMPIGAGMMTAGTLLCVLAAWHHRQTSHEIEQGKVKPAFWLVIFVGALVTVLAAVMITYLVLSEGRG